MKFFLLAGGRNMSQLDVAFAHSETNFTFRLLIISEHKICSEKVLKTNYTTKAFNDDYPVLILI